METNPRDLGVAWRWRGDGQSNSASRPPVFVKYLKTDPIESCAKSTYSEDGSDHTVRRYVFRQWWRSELEHDGRSVCLNCRPIFVTQLFAKMSTCITHESRLSAPYLCTIRTKKFWTNIRSST